MNNINSVLSKELNISIKYIDAVIDLLDQGNTVPFIARYRKEVTGGMSDETLRELFERLTYLRNLSSKKEDVIRLIEEQGKLTEELKISIINCKTVTEVEDLYRPYRPKRRTRATIAEGKGLKPLAETILEGNSKEDIKVYASQFVNEEKEVKTIEDALQGAMDIISEVISDEAEYRKWIRNFVFNEGVIETKGESKEPTPYEMYYDYKENVKNIPPHRILAINRGEKRKNINSKSYL